MTVAGVDVVMKRKVRDEQRTERRRVRRIRRAFTRCFWTWPVGHAWDYDDDRNRRVCLGCGKSMTCKYDMHGWSWEADF
jgi:hypothetical protein